MLVCDYFHVLAALSPWKEPQYPLDRRLSGPLAGLDDVTKIKVLPCQKSNPDHPAHSLVTILTELSRLSLNLFFNKMLLMIIISNSINPKQPV
jgi:hypothetical protein